MTDKILREMLESIRYTNYGTKWPPEYKNFLAAWSYFDGIFKHLYPGKGLEWKKFGRFALEEKHAPIGNAVLSLKETRILARMPCVGDGKDSYKPNKNVRFASQTLRDFYEIRLENVCNRDECSRRRESKNETCLNDPYVKPDGELEDPANAIYTPFGATLKIVYQVRNNLVHGSKYQFFPENFKRNKCLVYLSDAITRQVLISFEESIKESYRGSTETVE